MKNFVMLCAFCCAVAVFTMGQTLTVRAESEPKAQPVSAMNQEKIPAINEKDLKLEPETDAPPAAPALPPETKDQKPTNERPLLTLAKVVTDAPETDAIKITPDKPEIVTLDRDAVNVIVGSNETLRVVPDTNKALILIPKKPGSTYFKALDIDGKVIMQRHIIVGVAKKDYVRIRRTCAPNDTNCSEFSVYYCPDMCHEVNVAQNGTGESPPVPVDTAANRPIDDETAVSTEPQPVVDETGTVPDVQ